MKITKRQLRRIIKEEKRRLHEVDDDKERRKVDAQASFETALEKFIVAYDEYLGWDSPVSGIHSKISDIVSSTIKWYEEASPSLPGPAKRRKDDLAAMGLPWEHN